MSKQNHLYYKPTQEGMEKIEKLRAKVIELDDLLDELCPDPTRTGEWVDGVHAPAYRSKSLALTRLEEFRQRAIESIVRLHNSGLT